MSDPHLWGDADQLSNEVDDAADSVAHPTLEPFMKKIAAPIGDQLRLACGVKKFLNQRWAMKRLVEAGITVACCSIPLEAAHATLIDSHFVQLAGPSWTVDFTVTNDGVVPSIGEFTVFFDEHMFSNLTIISSPVAWDTITAQPDAGIPAAGFMDSLALAPAHFLAAGQSQGGFKLAFTLLNGSTLGALPYDIVNENFQMINSGNTTFSVTPAVPETSTLSLLVCGLLLVGLAAVRPRAKA